MEIILLKDMEKLGDKHDIVKVKPGYGRNYLIPQGLAVNANAVNRKKRDVIIAEDDCGSRDGVWKKAIFEGDDEIVG